MNQNPPDVVLLVPTWKTRAVLRAQLIEEGCEVVALDAWPIPGLYLRPGMNPRVLIIDLHDLPDPGRTLDEARQVLPAGRVLVVTALGSLAGDQVRERGFAVVERPASIGEISSATRALLRQAK